MSREGTSPSLDIIRWVTRTVLEATVRADVAFVGAGIDLALESAGWLPSVIAGINLGPVSP